MDYSNMKEKMEKTVSVFSEKLSEVRAGRANPAILNKVKIDYYGTPTPINQVAGVSVPEARLIVIQPWDISVLKEIEKAILTSDIGINPNNDGKVIRLAFPELNEERRKELVKEIKKMAEEAKVAVRASRRDGIENAKSEQKEGNITEDELKQAEVEIQKITDAKVEEIDKIFKEKKKEDVICFVGDGINDAPSLMRSDIGIAMGGVGSDAAIEAADMVLMHDDLKDLIIAKKISKKTMRIAYENIIFSLAIKALILILSAFGITNMWIAVFGDVGVAVIAILNAMRVNSKY